MMLLRLRNNNNNKIMIRLFYVNLYLIWSRILKKYTPFYFHIKIYFNDNIKNIHNYVYVFKYKTSIATTLHCNENFLAESLIEQVNNIRRHKNGWPPLTHNFVFSLMLAADFLARLSRYSVTPYRYIPTTKTVNVRYNLMSVLTKFP